MPFKYLNVTLYDDFLYKNKLFFVFLKSKPIKVGAGGLQL
jgi:hypothetical protein